jgi:hypothetical protein
MHYDCGVWRSHLTLRLLIVLQGVILFNLGVLNAQWTKHVLVPERCFLKSISLSPSGKVAVVGDEGTVRLSDGELKTWQSFTTMTTQTLRDVIMSDDGTAVAVGDSGVILSILSRTDVRKYSAGTTNRLNAISSPTNGAFVIVGDSGQIVVTSDYCISSVKSSHAACWHSVGPTPTDPNGYVVPCDFDHCCTTEYRVCNNGGTLTLTIITSGSSPACNPGCIFWCI